MGGKHPPPASDHLPPRWAGLSWLCPQPPRHPPALPQGRERPTQCLPSWGLQGSQGPLLCPISRTLSPSRLNPTPAGPRRNVYSLAHRPFQGRHPSLVAPRVQGAPEAQGQPVHGGSAPRGQRDPGRRRGQGWRATHTLTCPPTTPVSWAGSVPHRDTGWTHTGDTNKSGHAQGSGWWHHRGLPSCPLSLPTCSSWSGQSLPAVPTWCQA